MNHEEQTHLPSGEAPAIGAPADHRFSRSADIDDFIAVVERFERGELGADEFRAYRLVRGVYGQRQDGAHMLRVKIPGGVATPEQLSALAEVAESTPRKLGHVTTRQNLQFHFLEMAAMEGLMRRLDQVGITTRGACGNSVRNITGCPRAGLCPDEAFDSTPFIDALTRHFLRRPLAESLPRKFKIALSGCASDCALAAINDLGFVAHRAADGSRRFKVLAGGGLATLPTSAFVLHDSYPAERILEVAEAIVRLFDRTGNRENRNKARMKFVVRKLGREEFVRQYQEELQAVLVRGDVAELSIPDATPEHRGWTLPPFAGAKLAAFARANVRPTARVGRVFVTVRLTVGDVRADQLRGLAALAARYGEGAIRFAVDQNLLFRDVQVSDVPALFRELELLELAQSDAGTSADVTSCPGADSCKLAITNSKGLARELSSALSAGAVEGVAVKLSGCPNSCGQHHIASIGLHGGVRKIGERAAPHYLVMVGGGVGPEGAVFGKVAGKVPARRAAQAIQRLLALAERERGASETVEAWLRRAEQPALKAAILDLTELGAEAEEADFVDVGAEGVFQVVEMEGECAA